MSIRTELDLAGFITNPSAKLGGINIEEVVMYTGFTGEQEKYWSLNIDHELTLEYDNYSVNLSLTAVGRMPFKGNEGLSVLDMISGCELEFSLLDRTLVSDVAIEINGDNTPTPIRGLLDFWGAYRFEINFDNPAKAIDSKSLYIIGDDELRDEVLIAFKEGLNRNSAYTNHNLSKKLTDKIVEQLRQLAKEEVKSTTEESNRISNLLASYK